MLTSYHSRDTWQDTCRHLAERLADWRLLLLETLPNMKAKELADRLTEVQFQILGTHWPASKAQALVHSVSERLPEKKIKRRADLTGQGMR